MNKLLMLFCGGLAVLFVILAVFFIMNCIRARKEILSRDYSKDNSKIDLLISLLDMADNEDKEKIMEIAQQNLDIAVETFSSLPHEPGKTSKYINPLLDTFKFKISEELKDLFPKGDLIYTATKCSEDNFKISWNDSTGTVEKEYDKEIVEYYLTHGQWILVGEE